MFLKEHFVQIEDVFLQEHFWPKEPVSAQKRGREARPELGQGPSADVQHCPEADNARLVEVWGHRIQCFAEGVSRQRKCNEIEFVERFR